MSLCLCQRNVLFGVFLLMMMDDPNQRRSDKRQQEARCRTMAPVIERLLAWKFPIGIVHCFRPESDVGRAIGAKPNDPSLIDHISNEDFQGICGYSHCFFIPAIFPTKSWYFWQKQFHIWVIKYTSLPKSDNFRQHLGHEMEVGGSCKLDSCRHRVDGPGLRDASVVWKLTSAVIVPSMLGLIGMGRLRTAPDLENLKTPKKVGPEIS
mmetsp:Transcript_75527/g.164787  ORF Transcript_75527/g.164787 Transcript_75527/m.164787 type:complete len:208 (-) Transcript_75527:340-963(-)